MSSEPTAPLSLHYRLLLGVFRFLFRLLTRVDVRGLENVPARGGLILASNHISALEGPLIFSLVRRHPLTALAKLEWKSSPVGRFVLVALKPVYVARGEVDRVALKETVRRLKAGEAFGISPEGTRSRTATLLEGKEGLAYIAFQSGATIVPVATWGQEKFGREIKRFRRPLLHARFGEPFTLESDPALNRRENLTAATERIMLEIARMLPPEYRGFYAEKAAQLSAPEEAHDG